MGDSGSSVLDLSSQCFTSPITRQLQFMLLPIQTFTLMLDASWVRAFVNSHWSDSILLFCITCLYSAYSLSSFYHPFTRLLFICFFLLYFFWYPPYCDFCLIIFNVIGMLYQLFVRVSDQHESLCYIGHWAHFLLATYCYIYFLINVISVNTVNFRK